MSKQLFHKLRESLISVMPITLIIFILNFTPLINLSNKELITFLVSAFMLIIGISLFNLGADIAMTPMGEQVGATLMKSKRISIVLSVCFIFAMLITVAEPDLVVLANQVSGIVEPIVLVLIVGLGVGVFLLIGILKIVFKKNLSYILMFLYTVVFALVSILVTMGKLEFLSLAFDSGGVTTGPITVPFIMALGVGIASSIGGRKSSENSFGLISLCSVGPIIAILVLGIFSNGSITPPNPDDYLIAVNIGGALVHELAEVTKDVIIALGMISIFFLILQFIKIKLPVKKLLKMGIGIGFTFLGLVIFLTAVNIGFMPIGFKIGEEFAKLDSFVMVLFGFLIGFVVVLAEPAIHVLTRQVQEITKNGISKVSMLLALCIGVGISIGLSMIRIIYDFSILYYLVPGYLLSLGLSFFVPKIYTAVAFDSGGVASGPLTSTFILPLSIGACLALQGPDKVLTNGFGIVAMVAMTPLISIQLLGFKAVMSKKVKKRVMERKIIASDDERIISFR